MKLQLNIGLKAGKEGKSYAIGRAIATIAYYFNPSKMQTEAQVAGSGEDTAVIEIESEVYPLSVINSICKVLDQDCIAFQLMQDDGRTMGFLVGPNTEPYGGAFNAEYWLSPSWSK